MFFTKVGEAFAWLAFTLGVMRVAMAALLIYGSNDFTRNAILGTKSSGVAIDQGLYCIFGATCLGVLCEISKLISGKESDQ